MEKKALITGITGQDGSYLAELLLSKGYEVHGMVRRSSVRNRERLDHLSEKGSYTSDSERKGFYLHYGDLTDSSSVESILKRVMPTEVYNLGAQSHVRVSFDIPENTANIVALGTLRLLEGIRKICPKAKYYQASSSEMFGRVTDASQNENSPFRPRSPYARSKVFAFWETVGAREGYGLHASNGILFNHESERRGESFVTRKITRSLARIKLGLQKSLSLGNISAERDWGHAKDFVAAMWLILQQEEPGDYVIGTGEKHTVREFLQETAKCLGLKMYSNNKYGVEEKFLDENGNTIVEIDPQYYRPTEVDTLLANPEKARKILGWEAKIKFHDLVKLMADHDLNLAEEEAYLEKRKASIAAESHKKRIREIDRCRICGNKELVSLISLGNSALTGVFPKEDEEDPLEAPMELVKCDNSTNYDSCGLVQLKHSVNGEEMYGENYGYRSGLNNTMSNHLDRLAKTAERLVLLNQDDVVLDIGSNDATLLKSYTKDSIKIGIDPTGKKFEEHYPGDVMLISNFFSGEIYKAFTSKKAKIITSIAMFYDLEDPMKFVRDIKENLDHEGIWISEQSYMPKMMEMNSFDTICHEHIEYYSLKQIEWMLKKTGLRVFDLEFNDINGGSFRFYACHEENPRAINNEALNKVREKENYLRLDTIQPYVEFRERVEKIKKDLQEFIRSEKNKGKTIHLYGASTKGNTLLQFLELGKNLIDAAADRNPYKWGRVTPKTRIPIISEESSRSKKPDYYLVLPWHFKEEFIRRESEFLNEGGKFIFPLPEIEIVESPKLNLGQPPNVL